MAGDESGSESDKISMNDPDTGIRFSYFIQPIAYMGINDEYDDFHNTFKIKRARIDTRINIGKYICGRIQGDLTRSPALLDAYIDLKINDNISFRMGKYKSPLSLERSQSVPSLLFNDFAYTASVAPNRDIGVSFHGNFLNRKLDLYLACMNGSGSGGSSIGDPKDLIIHLGLSPFDTERTNAANKLLIAAGAMIGKRSEENMSGIKTPAGTDIFHYRASVTGQGKICRISPQIRLITDGVFLLGEYIYSDYGIADSAGVEFRVQDKVWTLSGGYLICGGNRTEKGVELDEDAVLSRGGKGALEFVARIHGYHADQRVFERFVSSAACASQVVSLETGLEWYYADNSCIRLIYTRSIFEKGSVEGDRPTENTIQLSLNLNGKL